MSWTYEATYHRALSGSTFAVKDGKPVFKDYPDHVVVKDANGVPLFEMNTAGPPHPDLAKTAQKIVNAMAFVAQIARMTTPYDPDQVDEFLRTWRKKRSDFESEEALREEIYVEYPSDDAIEEAGTLWRLIEHARELAKETP